MTDYATVNDVIALYRPLTDTEATKTEALIPVICARLRRLAKNYGRDLDQMLSDDEDLEEVAKSVVVDVVARNLQTPTSGAPMSQFSESALGYSVSGTFTNPGGGIFIKRDELAALGLLRPKARQVDMNAGGWTDV